MKKLILIMPLMFLYISSFGQNCGGECYVNPDYTTTMNMMLPFATEASDVEVDIRDGIAYIEGDIALGEVGELESRGVALDGDRWTNSTMTYEISGVFSSQEIQKINDAAAHISNNTNMCVVPRNGEANYIEFVKTGGCSSSVGMRGGRQSISLASGCGFGSTVHEFLHAAGVWHEQSREDRDNHIVVNFGNIQAGREHNFNKRTVGSSDYGNYDFGSLMHYSSFAFSANGQPTITTIPAGTPIGQRNGMSQGDIATIDAMYPNACGGGSACDNQGGDNDNDGVCANVDCDDNDASAGAQQTPGTACNDGNSNTSNDVIQADGCTCQGTTVPSGNPCTAVQVSGGANVTITNVTASLNLRIIGPGTGWSDQVICDGDCNSTEVVSGLSPGTYTVKALHSNPGCYAQYTFSVTGGGGNACDNQGGDNDNDGVCANVDCDDNDASAGAQQTPGTACNDGNSNTTNDVIQADGCTCAGTTAPVGNPCTAVQVSGGANVTITNVTASLNLRIIGPGTGWNDQVICDGDCNSTEVVSGLSPGTYTVKALHSNPGCYAQYTFSVTGGGGNACDNQGGDSDNDGVCANVDCDDNDASEGAQQTPGTACNDGNSNTTNDVIQADGCTCQGTTAPPGNCGVDLISFTRTTNSSDSNCDDYKLTVGISQSGPGTVQITNLPANGYSGSTPGVGSLGWAGQTAFNWNIPSGSNGVHLTTLTYCWAADTNAQATFNDGTCSDAVSVGGGADDISNITDIAIYPNPAKDKVFLNLEALAGNTGTISIFNSIGQTVKTFAFKEIPYAPIQWDTNEATNGIYLIAIQTNGQRIVKKVIINKTY